MFQGALAGLVLLLQVATPEDGPAWDPWGFSEREFVPASVPACETVPPQEVMLGVLYGFYRNVVSPVNGSNCPMYPSCSRFSRQAIEVLGIPEGLMATFDRLHRCGHDLRFYQLVLDGEKWLRYDPPASSLAGS